MPGPYSNSSERASSASSRQIRPYRYQVPTLHILPEAYLQRVRSTSVVAPIIERRLQIHPRPNSISLIPHPSAHTASLALPFQNPPSTPPPASSSSGLPSGYQTDYPRATAPRRPYIQIPGQGTVSPYGNEKAPPPEAYLILRPHRRPREGWGEEGSRRGGNGAW